MINSYIKCQEINKSYDGRKIINNFSYRFLNHGLYVIYGESGSGKTTLLNIISGAISFEGGKIDIFDKTFPKQVDENIAKENMAYITQNCHFVDYLNILDNLKLSTNDKASIKKIESYLKIFNIIDIKNKYPYQISGGEAERVAIISALLNNKKIILLDEPTASLDELNKQIVLNLLNKLKENYLIICATHDNSLKSIADKIIEYPFLSYVVEGEQQKLKKTKRHKPFLLPFILKQFIYKKSEKKSAIYLILALIVCFLIIFFCFDSKAKIEKSLLEYNKVNFVQFYCNVNSKDYCSSILKKYGVIGEMYDYESNELLFIENNNEELPSDNYLKRTLPYEKNLFPLQNKIIYGHYFENENDIIIGIDLAKELNENIQGLINTEYKVNVFDKVETFRIVGILDDVKDNIYMKSLLVIPENNYIYLNSKYMDKYKADERIGLSENNYHGLHLVAYFDNNDKLYAFLKDYEDYFSKYGIGNYEVSTIPMNFNFAEYNLFITSVKTYLTPTIIIVFLVALIFFFQIEYIKNYYQKHILAVYNYYGYKWKTIFLNNIISTLLYISCLFWLSFGISILLSNILNPILLKYKLVSYIAFLVDINSIIKLYICLIILSMIMSFINTLILKKKGWIFVLNEGEDLL